MSAHFAFACRRSSWRRSRSPVSSRRLIALRLFQDYTRDADAGRAAARGARARAALRASRRCRRPTRAAAPVFAAAKLEAATGDRLFYVGPSVFPGDGVRPDAPVRRQDVGVDLRGADRIVTFEFTPPGRGPRPSSPPRIRCGSEAGDTAVRRARSSRSRRPSCATRWVTLIAAARARVPRRPRRRRRARAGTCRAGSPGPCSRSRTAADEIAEGRYDVERARGAGRRRDRPPRRSLPRDGRAAGRGGGARAELPDVGLARAAHAADGDPRPRRGAARGRRRPIRSSPSVARRSSRRRRSGSARLVGDVLDLAKLDAHRFTVLTEEVDMGRLVRPRLLDVHRRGAAAGDRLPQRADGASR